MAFSAIQSVINTVGEVPVVIANLRQEFESLKGFLGDAEDRQEDDLVVKKWICDIRDLAYEAQELTEKHLHRIARYRQYQDERRIIKFRALLDAMVLAMEASAIKTLTNKISRMTSKMKAYGIEYRQEAESTVTSHPATADPIACFDENEGIVVGLDEDIKIIENQLVSVRDTKVVGICGASGLGKTTLVREVLKRGIVKAHFDHAIVWASLGTEFQVGDVLKNILLKLMGNSDDDNEENRITGLGEDALSGKISQILKDKTCLVVLDDLQTLAAWDCLKTAFSSIQCPDSSTKLVFTTCDAKVLSYVDRRGFIHQPRFLSRQERWELLLKKNVFAGKGIKGYIAKRTVKPIIEHCIGLPLTIHMIAGLIKYHCPLFLHMTTLCPCIKHKKAFPWGKCGDLTTLELEVKEVVKLSDAALRRPLRLCLRGMMEYDEEFEIPVEELFNKWSDMGLMAETCLDELVDRSLIQVVEKNNTTGKIMSCRLHSAVRHFYCTQST